MKPLVKVGLGAVALGVWVWLVVHPREPVYEGKRLGQWLADLDLRNPENATAHTEAVKAVRAIGTNALPELTRMLCARDSVWTKTMIQFNSTQGLLRLPATPSAVIQARGLQGFSALGSLAEPSVPRLVQILEAEPSPQARVYVALALGQIGRSARAATPALRRAADDKNEEVRRSAVSALINIQMWDESGRGVEPR
jgi:hypothetical protein